MNDSIRAALVNVIKASRQKMSRYQRQKGIKPQRWLYPLATEKRYATTIRTWLRPMKDYVHSYLKENQDAILRGDSADDARLHLDNAEADDISVTRLDAVPGKSFTIMIDALNGWLEQYVPADTEAVSGSQIYMGLGKIADSVFDFNERQFEKGAKSVLGVEFPVGEDWWPDARDLWAYNNYQTISGDMYKYVHDINGLVEKAVTSGLPVKELSKQITALDEKLFKGRANFIARDQTGKLNGQITQMRMESVGLSMYVWETSGDERVRGNPFGKYPDAIPSHYLMDQKLCRWDDASVYSEDGGKTWIDRPTKAPTQHPGMEYQCRCTAIAYWQELVGEADAQIDLPSDFSNNVPINVEGLVVKKQPAARSKNSSVQKSLKQAEAQRIAQNIEASEAYVKAKYPNEKFISDVSELHAVNKYSKGLIIPVNVKVAVSRLPINSAQRTILQKELVQAEILAKLGNSVFLTPEFSAYKVRVTDAIINGVPYEFRYISGQAKKVESEFSDAKKKGDDVNVLMTIESDIGKHEARRRISLVLKRNLKYTGKIIVSLQRGKTYFWDSYSFR